MEIKPKYVTFDQAKWLKEKGFDYHELFQDFADYYDYYDRSIQGRCHESDFSEDKFPDDKWIPVPEQWQVVEWLKDNQDIWVCVDREEGSAYWKFNIRLLQLNGHKYGGFGGEFNSPKEAYSAAFDYIKDNSHQYEK
jgi:hypothetical protein